MQHNTHSWSWAICLSFTSVASWILPLQGLSGNTASAAAPMPVAAMPDDDRGGPPPRFVQYSSRHLDTFAELAWHPVMDLLGVRQSENPSSMGVLELEHEWENDDLPLHGTRMVGNWGNTPVEVEVLDSQDSTGIAHMLWNGIGDTPDPETAILIEEGIRITNNAVIVHNLNTGDRLGMMLELTWFEATDDDSDDFTTFPMSIPTKVVENPGPDFFEDNLLFPDYADWCDYILTMPGRDRANARWYEACMGVFACARWLCENGGQAFWCPFNELFDGCGNLNLKTELGLARFNFDTCMGICANNFNGCMLAALGIGAGPAGTAILSLACARRLAAAIAACGATGPLALPCILTILGGTVIWIGVSYWHCGNRREMCERGCQAAWQRAVNNSLARAIEEGCS